MIAFDKEDNEIFAFGKHKGVKVDKILEKNLAILVGYKMQTSFIHQVTAIKLRKLNTKN
jgi:DNA polymerase-3 subunit epsilon